MERAPVAPSVEIVAEALVLRNRQLQLAALEVLDQVMRGRYGRRGDFGESATPPSPFSLLVAEALDCMPRSDWAGLWRCGHPGARPLLLKVWLEEVWPKSIVRYSLY